MINDLKKKMAIIEQKYKFNEKDKLSLSL